MSAWDHKSTFGGTQLHSSPCTTRLYAYNCEIKLPYSPKKMHRDKISISSKTIDARPRTDELHFPRKHYAIKHPVDLVFFSFHCSKNPEPNKSKIWGNKMRSGHLQYGPWEVRKCLVRGVWTMYVIEHSAHESTGAPRCPNSHKLDANQGRGLRESRHWLVGPTQNTFCAKQLTHIHAGEAAPERTWLGGTDVGQSDVTLSLFLT